MMIPVTKNANPTTLCLSSIDNKIYNIQYD